MQTITVKLDDSIYQKFLNIIELFPKSKLKIIDGCMLKPNKYTLDAINDSGRKSFMDYFASAKNYDTIAIENAISECRKVDLDGWK